VLLNPEGDNRFTHLLTLEKYSYHIIFITYQQ
jgi:hypothetical protein